MCKTKTNGRKAWRTTLAITMTLLAAACAGGGGGGSSSDGANAPSIGGLTDSGYLAYVAMGDATVQRITGQGPTGFDGMHAVALDPATGVLYGIAGASSISASVLVRVDATAGAHGLASAPAIVAELLPYTGTPSTLAWHPGEGMLYGVLAGGGSLIPGRLIRIDPATGVSADLGQCAKVTSLTYDPVTDALYGVRGSQFFRIQPGNGASLELFSESGFLPKVKALALDPLTGLFHGAFHDETTEPGVVTIDLFGNVDEVATIAETLVDLELDPATGALLGLSNGGSIVAVQSGAPAYSVEHRGNVGMALFDCTYDPATQSYFGIDRTGHLVRFQVDGSCRTIGRVDIPTRKLVYDSTMQRLWGFGGETIFTSTDTYVFEIDTATAATSTPVLTNLSVGTVLTYDSTNHVIRGISGGNNVTVTLVPETGQAFATANASTFEDMRGLAWDPLSGRLVGSWSDSVPDRTRIHAWDPHTSGNGQVMAIIPMTLRGLYPHPTPGKYLAFGAENDLFEVTLGVGNTSYQTTGAVMDAFYRSAVYVPQEGRILAATNDTVWSIDPTNGATTRKGSTPGDDSPWSIGWDPERERLGFLMNDEIRWTSLNAPWNSSHETSLQGLDVRHMAFAPERGVFYLLGGDGLHTMAVNDSGASFVAVSSVAPPETVTDVTWKNGALWVATSDARLHRVDPDTGAWTDVGTMRFGMQALY